MKKSRNYTWLVLGIITIVLGVIIPLVFMQQSTYFESEKNVRAGATTYNINITSKDEIKDIKNAVVRIESADDQTKEFEVYYVKLEKSDKDYVYKIQLVVTHDWNLVEDIEEIEIFYGDDSITIDEKVGPGTKITIAAFTCIIGGFMIFVNFFNNNAKNRTIELKEIIAASVNNENINIGHNDNNVEETNPEEEFKEEIKQVEETKTCEYCGTLADVNDKECASCGAKFKK